MNEAEELLELLTDNAPSTHSVVTLNGSLNDSRLTAAKPAPNSTRGDAQGGVGAASQRGCFQLPLSVASPQDEESARAESQRAFRMAVEGKSGIRISRPTAAFDQLHLVQAQFPHIPLSLYSRPGKGTDHSSSVAVVVAKFDPKASSGKGGQYATIKVWDMMGFCAQSAVRVLLTGTAFREHYGALDVGSVVCLVRAALLPPKEGGVSGDSPMLHVSELDQLKRLGHATDFGYCRATTEGSGQPCRNPVNVSSTPYCMAHLTAQRVAVKRQPTPTAPLITKSKATATQPPQSTVKALTLPYNNTIRPANDLLCVRSKRVVSQVPTTTVLPQHQPLDLRFGGGPPMTTGLGTSVGSNQVAATLGTGGRGKLVLDAALRQTARNQTDTTIREALKRPRNHSEELTTHTTRVLSYAPLVGHRDPLLANVVLSQPSPTASRGAVADTVRSAHATTSNIVRLADSLQSQNDHLRATDARVRLDRAGKVLADADRVITALGSVEEKKVRAIECLTCNRWQFHRPETCVAAGHVLRSGEVMQRYVECEHCHEKATVLGDVHPALLLPRCPRCRQAARWNKSTAAPPSLKSLAALRNANSGGGDIP